MGDMIDGFKALKSLEQSERQARLGLAHRQFQGAANRLAAAKPGLELVMCAEAHFQVRGFGWRIDVYPSTQKLVPRGTLPSALLSVEYPAVWTLDDLVDSLIERT